MAMCCDPFVLFPEQVETGRLVRKSAPGLPETGVCEIAYILKRVRASNQPNEAASVSTNLRYHIKPDGLPDELGEPSKWLDLILIDKLDDRYLIVEASRGDDMTTGQTLFWTVKARPWRTN